jgi:hypothetical protein
MAESNNNTAKADWGKVKAGDARYSWSYWLVRSRSGSHVAIHAARQINDSRWTEAISLSKFAEIAGFTNPNEAGEEFVCGEKLDEFIREVTESYRYKDTIDRIAAEDFYSKMGLAVFDGDDRGLNPAIFIVAEN